MRILAMPDFWRCLTPRGGGGRNSLPGVKPVTSFKNAKAGASRIWECIQVLEEATAPEAKAAKPIRQEGQGWTRQPVPTGDGGSAGPASTA